MPKSYYERFWSKIVRGEPYVGRVENKRKDGTRYIDEMHVAPILNDADTLQYYIEFHPDLASKQERIDFKKEFIFAGVTSAEPMRLAHLLSRWMDQDVTLGVLSRDSLIRFLEQAYIAETQHALKARKNDLELIHEAQRQAEKFSEIYIKYVFQVRAFFSHRVNEEALAEDFTHETFERAFRALPSFTPSNASYLTYLLRIAHNLLVSHYRKSSQIISKRPYTVDMYEVMEQRDAIDRGLRQLGAGDRRVIQMKYQEGKRIKEIAERMKKSENAVKLQLSRARKKLRELIISGEKAG